jgi:proline iminopeptidase
MQRREFLAATAALAASAAAPAGARPNDGERMIDVGSGHRVWTQRVGQGATKVLLLHGGPGFSHDYLACFADFLPQAGFEIYFYDQLGCGRSDHPNDDRLWTLPRYLDEVEAVRRALGLEQFVLYGHSWGAILGIEYALKYGQHLSKLVLSDMTAGIADYIVYADRIRAQLPAKDRATLAKYEALNKTDDPAYQAVIMRIYAQHVLRLPQWPKPVSYAIEHANQRIYNLMQGPNEFVITGNLKSWDRWGDLHNIKTPTLVMGAKYDEMNPDSIRREGRLIPGAKTWISEHGSHLCMWDDQKAYFAALLGFLKGAA